MNKLDIKNSFKKVVLAFDTERAYANSIRLLITGFLCLGIVLAFYIYTGSYYVLSLFVLPVGVFWKSADLYFEAKRSSHKLRDVHNVEISEELRKFSGKGFKKSIN